MKKILTLLIFLFSFAQINFAQSESDFERRGHGAFFELGGSAITYSMNYETRFGATNRGLGARVGIGFSSLTAVDCITVPIVVNYMLGKKNGKNYLELGAGYTYADLRESENFKVNDETVMFEGTSFMNLSLMYHRHPPLGGFMWKIGFTPLLGNFSDGRVFLPYLGLAFGYAM